MVLINICVRLAHIAPRSPSLSKCKAVKFLFYEFPKRQIGDNKQTKIE